MFIYRYEEDSLTGYQRVLVADDYELQKGELKELPNPCYTPMILDDKGNLVSNTLEASNEKAKEYLENNDLSSNAISANQQMAQLSLQVAQQQKTNSTQISMLTKQVATLQATVNGLTAANKEG